MTITRASGSTVAVKLTKKEGDRFLRFLAEVMADRLPLQDKAEVKKKTPKPAPFTLEKPETKRASKKGERKGPIVYRSKDVDFSLQENRVRETRALVRKRAKEAHVSLRKAATMLRYSDFRKNGLGLVMNRLNNSPYLAVREAVPEFKIMPWEMSKVPDAFWKVKRNVKVAVEWMLGQTGKTPEQINNQDFKDCCLRGLNSGTESKSIYLVFVDANIAYSPRQVAAHSKTEEFGREKYYPWELARIPRGYYKCAKNRIAATRWMVWDSGQEPGAIRNWHFEKRGMSRLLRSAGKVGYIALLREAGFDV